MNHCLLFFLDGIGLGSANPHTNPFARQPMPALSGLLNGQNLLEPAFRFRPQHSERASWLALDTCLGVPGLPQSATGQATLLTGLNIPSLVGTHDGPKPSPAIKKYLDNGSLFHCLRQTQHSATLLNAYPPGYFEAIQSGRRLPGAIAMAAVHSGIALKNTLDLQKGQALSADFTGQGWQDHLHIPGIPVITPYMAGARMAQLSLGHSFTIFEYWLSDITGHHREMQPACQLITQIDDVLSGLIQAWTDEDGLILITSDHGNLEDLSTRKHTTNPVPFILIGAPQYRQRFLDCMGNENPGSACDLTRVAPAIFKYLN